MTEYSHLLSGQDSSSVYQSTRTGESSNDISFSNDPEEKEGGGNHSTTGSENNNNYELHSLVHLPHKGTIGMLGSVAIAVNSLTGPAMINLPSLYQTSGFIPTTVTLALLCVLSNLCSLHLANVISLVPGNRHFHKELEYSDTFRHFGGQKAFIFTHILFFLCITCLNIASIVDTAQVVDQIIANKLHGGAVALAFNYSSGQSIDYDIDSHDNHGRRRVDLNIIRWHNSSCAYDSGDSGDVIDVDFDECIPFHNSSFYQDSSWLLTLGYIVAGLIFIPMSLKDLKENSTFQIVAFIVLIILSIQFIYIFISYGINIENITLWGDDWSDLFGVCLFNFTVVVAVPAWLYEKKPSVNVSTALNGSSFIAFILYVSIGSLGAMTMKNVTDNMLQSMMSGAFGPVTKISSMIFAFFIIGLGIPLFSVLTRLNLTGSGLCSEFLANLLAVYMPWSISWMFYNGGATTTLLGWGGIFFTSIVVFLAPLFLALNVAFKDKGLGGGSIQIYGNIKLTKRNHIMALYILCIFSIVSIILAVISELYD